MFYDRFIKLCERKGVTPATAAKEIGLSNSVTTYWKRGSVPKVDTMQKIAGYFNIPISLLYGYQDSTDVFLNQLAEYAPDAVIMPLGDRDIDNDKANPRETDSAPTKPDILDEVDIAFYDGYRELSEDDKETIRRMVEVMRERRQNKKPPQD